MLINRYFFFNQAVYGRKATMMVVMMLRTDTELKNVLEWLTAIASIHFEFCVILSSRC